MRVSETRILGDLSWFSPLSPTPSASILQMTSVPKMQSFDIQYRDSLCSVVSFVDKTLPISVFHAAVRVVTKPSSLLAAWPGFVGDGRKLGWQQMDRDVGAEEIKRGKDLT